MNLKNNHKYLIGIFDHQEKILRAAKSCRKKGFVIHDAYTPFAVHGLDHEMRLDSTRLTSVCFLLGVIGFICALGFEIWTMGLNWPMNVGGKSTIALPAIIPVAFEITILFAAIGTVIAFFIRTKLWPGKKINLWDSDISDDHFVLVFKRSGKASEELLYNILEDNGAKKVYEVEGVE